MHPDYIARLRILCTRPLLPLADRRALLVLMAACRCYDGRSAMLAWASLNPSIAEELGPPRWPDNADVDLLPIIGICDAPDRLQPNNNHEGVVRVRPPGVTRS